MVSRLLQFVDHCHGIVLHRDETVTFSIHEHVVLTYAVLARTGPLLQIAEVGSAREENPVDVLHPSEVVQIELAKALHARQPCFGQRSRVNEWRSSIQSTVYTNIPTCRR